MEPGKIQKHSLNERDLPFSSNLGFCGDEGNGRFGTFGAVAPPRVGKTGGGSEGG